MPTSLAVRFVNFFASEPMPSVTLLARPACKVIRGHQRSSVVISGHQRSSVVISGHQWSSVVISGHLISETGHTRQRLGEEADDAFPESANRSRRTAAHRTLHGLLDEPSDT